LSHDDRPLLVFFTSHRSGPARRMESLLAHLARKERHRVRVHQVDVERRPDLADKLRVESAPAIVLVKDRRVVARIAGRASAPQIEALLDEHLDRAASVLQV
jgi:thioredoxin-like negative regulator of GroEL